MEPGTRLDHYEIVDKLGEGGMGEVWRARDTKLGRDVALKVLPPQVAADAERIARFERESRLLASLNHSGIAAIYGMQQAGDSQALVLELVPGQTLAERIAAGPVPMQEALSIALQLAEAMEYAHERGIVHRDLKPANVKIDETPDGEPVVKVLDFGLAVALGPEQPESGGSSSLDNSPTMSLAATRAGMILGTAAYMSPEQAKGKPVDRRADIWAFGVLFAEMLRGRRLFGGETPSEVMAAVIMQEVALDDLPAETPPPVRRLLQRCLRKEPRARLRDIGDARIVLQEVLDGDEPAGAGAATISAMGRTSLSRRVAAIATAMLLGAAGAWVVRPRPVPPPHRAFALQAPFEGASLPRGGALSPDGRRVAYTESGDLWVHDLTTLRPRLLAEDADAIEPFWSPDGRWVLYASAQWIMRVATEGGEPERLGTSPAEWSTAGGGALLPDGRILFSTGDSGLLEIPAVGGEPRVALPPGDDEIDFHDVTALPEGRGVLFVAHTEGGGRRIIAFDGTRRTNLVEEGEDPTYSPTGHVLYARDDALWAIALSLDSLQAEGTPFRVLTESFDPSAALDGTLLYHERDEARVQLTWYDEHGRRVGAVGGPFARGPGRMLPMRVSPDDSRVAYSVAETEDEYDVWVIEADSGEATRLTFERGGEFVQDWSPDGSEVVYVHVPPGARGAGSATMRIARVDGSDSRELGVGASPVFSPDGERLLFISPASEILSLRLGDVEAEPEVVLGGPEAEGVFRIAVSPNGRNLAFSRNMPEGGATLELLPLGGEGDRIVAIDGKGLNRFGLAYRWLPGSDGLVLVARFGLGLQRIDVSTRGDLRVGPPRRLMIDVPRNFDVAGDGRYLAAAPATDSGVGYGLVVVQNWFAPFESE